MKNKNRKKKPAKPFKNEIEAKRVLAYLEANGKFGLRNATLLEMSIGTGYRMGDLVGLTVLEIKDFLNRGEFCILESKKINTKNIRKANIKPRIVPIPINLDATLRKYIKDKEDYEYMFPSNKVSFNHISVDAISKAIKKAGEAIGVYGLSAHTGRKTYAQTLYEVSDYDIMVVKDDLGHSSIEETKAYLNINRYKKKEHLEKLNKYL